MELLRLMKALTVHGVKYALIGGGALNLHGLTRATEDVDIFVQPTLANIEALRSALKSLWADDSIDGITAEDLCGEYPAIRYGPPEGIIAIDIITRLGELVAWPDLDIETIVVQDVVVRIVTPATLYWMKKATLRPQDQADAAALKRVFDLADPESEDK